MILKPNDSYTWHNLTPCDSSVEALHLASDEVIQSEFGWEQRVFFIFTNKRLIILERTYGRTQTSYLRYSDLLTYMIQSEEGGLYDVMECLYLTFQGNINLEMHFMCEPDIVKDLANLIANAY